MTGPPPLPPLHAEALPGATLVRVTCRHVDEAAAGGLAEQLLALAATYGAEPFYLHLGEVEFFTSALLGKLVLLNRTLRDRGSRLSLLAVRPPVYQVFAVSRLTDLLDIRRGASSHVTPGNDDRRRSRRQAA